MNVKQWLNDEKGGHAFVIVLMLVLFAGLIYAYSLLSADATPRRRSEAELLALAERIKAEDSIKALNTPPLTPSTSLVPDSLSESIAALEPDTLAEPAVAPVTKPATKPKSKYKPKAKKVSAETMVRSRLKAGKSVRQIAKETGLPKKYIRELKKRKECNCQ